MTIEPALTLLERMGYITVHHRNVNTLPELSHHLKHWGSKAFAQHRFLYMGFHGEPEFVYIGNEPLGLETFAAQLAGWCADRVIFLASCGALASDDTSLQGFCKKTEAEAIVGYTEEVPFVEAAAFEMILFEHMAAMPEGIRPIRSLYKQMTQEYPDFAARLGFRVSTRSWTSPLGL
nr:DUF6642 family protein [Gordonia bronchialis]